MKKFFPLSAVLIIAMILTSCSSVPEPSSASPIQSVSNGAFAIEAGSGANSFLTSSLVSKALAENGVTSTTFPTTGTIKNHMVAAVAGNYNNAEAFMPESLAWIPTAMTGGTTIATSKMVLGVTSQEMANLGLKPGETNSISFDTLIERINDKSLVPMLCNPSQCDSGLLFYLSALMHISGKTSLEFNLADQSEASQQIIAKAKTLMDSLNISTSSSGDAREAMYRSLTEGGTYNALWSYEPEIAALDTQLVSEGKEPLYVVYVDSAIDAAQTLVMNPVYAKDDVVKAIYDKVVATLSGDKDIQTAIAATGWRPSLYGVHVSTAILKPEWGFQDDPKVATYFAPRFDVAMPLMRTYSSVIRKPIILFMFDDFSGSMRGNGGSEALFSASQYLFSDAAATDFLDATEGDVTQVYLFDTSCVPLPAVTDVNPEGYANLLTRIQGSLLNGNTSMFACGKTGLQLMADKYKQACSTTHNCALVFMTDGGDNECLHNPNNCTTVDNFNQAKIDLGLQDIPVWAVPFGNGVDMDQLQSLAGDNICQDTITACFQKIKGSR